MRWRIKIRVVLEASDEVGYTVYIPSLPGCISEGNTEEEALANIKEAIELYNSDFPSTSTLTGTIPQ